MLRILSIIFVFFLLVSCSSTLNYSGKLRLRRLDFEDCLLEQKGFSTIEVTSPRGYSLKKYNYHGFCEYRFKYRDSLFFYISTEIYSGSNVNSANRKNIGIDTYAIDRSLEPVDTIKNYGKQPDGNYWLEYILGGHVVGYANVPPDRLDEFNRAVSSIKQIK
ncbi:MAG: hypothetical protein IPN33_23590 [Saprospiraceae bacterium]|nr:hypothetical protein [Saprospiraceae bacterium]